MIQLRQLHRINRIFINRCPTVYTILSRSSLGYLHSTSQLHPYIISTHKIQPNRLLILAIRSFKQNDNNNMRNSRQSQRNPLSNSTHIMEQHLEKKNKLIERYRNSTHENIQKISRKPSRSNRYEDQPPQTQRKHINRSRAHVYKIDSIPYDGLPSTDNLNDYQKLILGMEYALEGERKKRQSLQNKCNSLETQISNLRNLLVGPNEEKHYQKTVFKQYQQKINILEAKVVEQKKNYQFIIDSKNQALASLEFELRTLEKKIKEEQKQSATSKKMLELMGQIQELRQTIIKKNIRIERLKYHQMDESGSDDEDIKKIAKMKKIEYYSQQLQISNKLILRKNIQILNNNNKILKYEEVLDVIQHYLDKKQVKNVDLNILQHACVNKLRLLLREKAVFERELLNQLNEHNKKIANFEQQIVSRDSVNGNKIVEVVNDNKRLSALVGTLQNTIKNLQKSLEDEKREEQILRNQIEINKKQFVDQIKKLKEQLNTISNVTKNEFDRMKLQNIKLTEQNRSLLFLVGQKEKELYKKGQSIKIHEQYKEKINNLNVDATEKRKIESVGEDNPQIGTKLVLINTFSQWMMEWNKIRNWNNKKVLLNIILDKEQIRTDSLNSMTYLINILHEALLNSKNIQIQQRAIILLSYYIKDNILKNINLFVDKIAPIVARGFRQIIEGQDQQRHRILNEASLKIISAMQRNGFKWSAEMTNEMLSVNGLKCLFNTINNSKVDQMVEYAYNCLIMIARQNQMISFLNSFNVTTSLLKNLNHQYSFIIFNLELLKALLASRDYVKSQKSLLEFKKIYNIIKESQDEQTINLTLDCSLLLMENSLYVKSLNKIQIISILSQAIRNLEDYHILKKIGEVYSILLAELQTQNIPKMVREAGKLIDIIKTKKFSENRFNRALRIILKISEMVIDNKDLDEQIVEGVAKLYEYYESIEGKTRLKLNNIISVIYDRNREVINKFSTENWIGSLIQAYKQSTNNQQIIFLLKIMQFQQDQKKTTEVLRTGRQTLINKLINDALIPQYTIAFAALKNLLHISKEKYAQKFVNKSLFGKLVNKVLTSRNQQQYIGTVISILYYFCKNEETSLTIIELGLVQRVFTVITERHEKQNLVYKCLTLLELCHTTNYKRKILNYLLTSDSNLQILKALNFILKKAKNKQQMGTRAVFIYDFLNGKTSVESLSILVEQNPWMVEDLIDVRNQFVQKVDPLVYKIELLLHNMSTVNAKVRKIYEKFKVEGDYNSEDDN